jgi:hypothetical protein
MSKFKLITLIGLSFKYGGSPSTISMAIIPKLHMSTFGPYCLRETTSGAILVILNLIEIKFLEESGNPLEILN